MEWKWLFGILIMMAALVPVYALYRLMGPITARIQYRAGQVAVQIGGPAALYVILVWKLWGLLPVPPAILYEPWDVKGEVILEDQQQPLKEEDISILPPDLIIGKDLSSFTMNVTKKPNKVGQLELPTLLIQHKGHKSISIDLNFDKYETEDKTKAITTDKLNKKINIGKVKLKKRED